ncbi:MAG: GtrA family protein [bacterium]
MSVTPEDKCGLAHAAGFVASGVMAFATDAVVLQGLLFLTSWSALVCRLIAIPCAMVVGWQMHRRLTFAVKTKATWREFRDFAAVGWVAAALNYGVFAGVVIAVPTLWPLVALVISSGVAMVFSYLGYRFHVFK